MRARGLMTCLPVVLLAAASLTAPITFDEIADRAGVRFVSNSCPTSQKHQPEPMVGGVAIFDFDGDGYADLYFVNGADMPSLQKTGPQYQNRLFRNNRDLTFTDVTEKAGVVGAGHRMRGASGGYGDRDRTGHCVPRADADHGCLEHRDGTCT